MTATTLERGFDVDTGAEISAAGTNFIEEKQQKLLAAEVEELAGLRFSIVITAKWEASRDEDPQRRAELRAELEDLRTRYFEKIDRIAMAFGVAIAIQVKEEVEHRVTLPLHRMLAEVPIDEDDNRIEEDQDQEETEFDI